MNVTFRTPPSRYLSHSGNRERNTLRSLYIFTDRGQGQNTQGQSTVGKVSVLSTGTKYTSVHQRQTTTPMPSLQPPHCGRMCHTHLRNIKLYASLLLADMTLDLLQIEHCQDLQSVHCPWLGVWSMDCSRRLNTAGCGVMLTGQGWSGLAIGQGRKLQIFTMCAFYTFYSDQTFAF